MPSQIIKYTMALLAAMVVITIDKEKLSGRLRRGKMVVHTKTYINIKIAVIYHFQLVLIWGNPISFGYLVMILGFATNFFLRIKQLISSSVIVFLASFDQF